MDTPHTPTDRFEELDHIDLDAVFDVLDITCRNLLPDLDLCTAFLARILKDRDAGSNPGTQDVVLRLIRKAVALAPFNHMPLDIAARLTGDAEMKQRAKRIAGLTTDPSIMDMRNVMNNEQTRRRKRNYLDSILERTPGHIVAASQRLLFDFYAGREPGDWINTIKVPKFARHHWQERLFLHYAPLGINHKALELWDEISSGPVCEVQLNLAAEMFISSGDTPSGIALYRESLKLDPAQGPIRHRLAELENPTQINHSLVREKDVVICLYSWNKADDLSRTLASLAKTDIGTAKIRVLLNGCTDHSAEAVEQARSLFPDNDFGAIPLPTNIGAPAARNWLGSLPEVRACEFAAYIDDDVELPADWLARFLTVMKDHPDTTAVGCKVVFGSNPKMIQYLHRTFSLAEPGIIKLTVPNLVAQYDRGQYNFIRETDTVMGCCHLLRMAHMPDGPQFDIRYSPSQIDDVAHDLALRIQGRTIRYCGLVTCIHHQNTGGGFKRSMSRAQLGQVHGNDMKMFHNLRPHLERIHDIMQEGERY
ncbi:glycosyltransferase family A protein [uncultured Pseudodesulfovibrio sp.]|uniref:glycosyltransferase family A protein n=1 Tax=uncultured Pseudodesulfovibrio sp. TaxID=2035858 RepID=UPI0029C691EE|nr:glycosyltransferase family A protein [uncultured Pseudodesulfovibrio sp.]